MPPRTQNNIKITKSRRRKSRPTSPLHIIHQKLEPKLEPFTGLQSPGLGDSFSTSGPRADEPTSAAQSFSSSIESNIDHSLSYTPASSFNNEITMGGQITGFPPPAPSTFGSNGGYPPPQVAQVAQPLEPYQSASDVVTAAYGDVVKLESMLCKKLANMTALRLPNQRRPDQKLNVERRSNVEALMAHVTGMPPQQACKNCYKGHGPWTECIVLAGQMCGSCANCWFNASGARCTFHGERMFSSLSKGALSSSHDSVSFEAQADHGGHPENNHPQPQPIYGPGLQTPAILPAYQASPPNETSRSFQSESDRWAVMDMTTHIVNQAMGESRQLSIRGRYVARIQAAARELSMRIAKYDEYLQTPHGIMEQQRDQDLEQQRLHAHAQAPAPEASMDDSFSSDSLS